MTIARRWRYALETFLLVLGFVSVIYLMLEARLFV